jgi:hypothetical protein
MFVGKTHRSAINKETGIEVATKETKNTLTFLIRMQNKILIRSYLKVLRRCSKVQILRNNGKKTNIACILGEAKKTQIQEIVAAFQTIIVFTSAV